MATQQIDFLPEHIGQGGYVRVADWVGQIEDIAISNLGRVLLLIRSPKMTWRNGGTEWLEYLENRPTLIQPATVDDYKAEIKKYSLMCQMTAARINSLPVDE